MEETVETTMNKCLALWASCYRKARDIGVYSENGNSC